MAKRPTWRDVEFAYRQGWLDGCGWGYVNRDESNEWCRREEGPARDGGAESIVALMKAARGNTRPMLNRNRTLSVLPHAAEGE
jgi:hypothetical protein